MKTKEFEFNGSVVTFETERGNVMVNATEMAKPFGKEVSGFLKTDGIKNYIKAYCQTEDLPFENEFSTNGNLIKVVQGGSNPGTWMERRVALKFASWLDPFFEVWVYSTIDDLMFGSYKEDDKSLKEIAKMQVAITEKEVELEKSPLTKEIETLKLAIKNEQSKITLRKNMRLSSFRSMFTPEEMNGEEKEK